ncbi:putative ABC transporter ATP-binding protein YxlF [Pelotomaculum schinkii]|uniref:Putative ABC transporter ATP-binding protein YxlF n=1 Tax=Pelotomaculum schinkii TaxID=78350 RepID=A0A4Y7RAE4_9FIRM|nr:ATP-binding cassette domain-containing protein [Pelotomaculum schinkii]TEB05689.1 putative ABC transporter ATP-binding protein YxlF [Pelotomaculum schinkii]
MSDIIATTGLCKQYGKVLRVKDLDLKVPEGTVYGFLGPNGAGKSTTMKMILGLARPTAGTVTVFGKQLNRRNRLAILKDVGSLIESPSYYGHLTGTENLRIICVLKGVPDKDINRVLHIVRLENQKEKKVSQYSMGMKQRLGLACALLGNPKLLILDEPTNGLDPAGMQEMRELICSLPQQYGMTVMVSSHLLSEIDQIATNVGIISRGELIFQDSLATLYEKSRTNIAVRTQDNEAAAKILGERGVSCQPQDHYLLLPRLSDNELVVHISRLFERNIGVVRIEERRKSLEDIFLELTGTAVSL